MNAFQIELIGYVAALCTTLCWLPQAIHTIRLRDTRAISVGMYVTLVIGILIWLVYGALIWSLPIIVANAVTLVLVLVILGMKLRYG